MMSRGGKGILPFQIIPYMSYSNIRFEVGEDGIAVLTVSRPEKLNALNAETVLELRDAMANIVVDNIQALIDGRAPPNCFNPQVLTKS